jgi:hypothetical protein
MSEPGQDSNNTSSTSDNHGAAQPDPPMYSTRWPELGLALLLMTIAVIVLIDARRLGTGWDEFDGPRSGYFPFYVACLLLASSGWIALSQLLSWRKQNPDFANRTQLGSVWAIVWPMTLYIGAVQPLGIYVASMLLIGFFMLRHGKYRWPTVGAVAFGVPLFFFAIFERYFLVALPKGPIEAWLGF